MIVASIKHEVMEKFVRALKSRNTTRARLIEILLENHFSEMIAAMCRNSEMIAAMCRNSEMIAAMCRNSEMIAAMCRNSEMIAAMCRNSEMIAAMCRNGQFKYVGSGKIKVIIGAGSQRLSGWLCTDINMLNIIYESSWGRLFSPDSIDNILAEHVFEHLSLDELYRALEHVRTYLKPGGIVRVAVPDAFHPSRYYYNLVKPGGYETPNQHKLFFDFEMMTRVAEGSGYKIRLLEYFDESGIFHKENYSQDDGVIQRCAENNRGLDTSDEKVMGKFYSTIPQHLRQQFYDQKMTYTSLIVDLSK